MACADIFFCAFLITYKLLGNGTIVQAHEDITKATHKSISAAL